MELKLSYIDKKVFKVLFNKNRNKEEEVLSLTFNILPISNHIKIPISIITKLKKLSEQYQNVTSIQNIQNVVNLDNQISHDSYNYYIVILFKIKKNLKKEGLLIGNVKNSGDVLIGIWPFNLSIENQSSEKLMEKLKNLINNPRKYDEICIIFSL